MQDFIFPSMELCNEVRGTSVPGALLQWKSPYVTAKLRRFKQMYDNIESILIIFQRAVTLAKRKIDDRNLLLYCIYIREVSEFAKAR